MSKILEKYQSSEFAKLADKSADKTPLSADEVNKLHKDEKALTQARGGKLNQKNYSDSVER